MKTKTTKGHELQLSQKEVDLIYAIKNYATPDQFLRDLEFASIAVEGYQFPCADIDLKDIKSKTKMTLEVISVTFRKLL